MNQRILMITACIMAAGFATQAEARPKSRFDETTQTCRIIDSGPLEWDSRPWGEGGKVFREVCKSCHTRDNDKGAPFLHSESKSSNGWNRVFTKKYPQCAKDGAWNQISGDQLLKLNDYLFRFALNSEDMNDSC
ncbi:MAG: hypothetical protein BM485_14980 [Desulfobulbaceae bacterium DB1]|nr:MAG: hypothetical protein BM485_14980 [Desulfobulbaceae bacterium DB1]